MVRISYSKFLQTQQESYNLFSKKIKYIYEEQIACLFLAEAEKNVVWRILKFALFRLYEEKGSDNITVRCLVAWQRGMPEAALHLLEAIIARCVTEVQLGDIARSLVAERQASEWKIIHIDFSD